MDHTCSAKIMINKKIRINSVRRDIKNILDATYDYGMGWIVLYEKTLASIHPLVEIPRGNRECINFVACGHLFDFMTDTLSDDFHHRPHKHSVLYFVQQNIFIFLMKIYNICTYKYILREIWKWYETTIELLVFDLSSQQVKSLAQVK